MKICKQVIVLNHVFEEEIKRTSFQMAQSFDSVSEYYVRESSKCFSHYKSDHLRCLVMAPTVHNKINWKFTVLDLVLLVLEKLHHRELIE